MEKIAGPDRFQESSNSHQVLLNTGTLLKVLLFDMPYQLPCNWTTYSVVCNLV